MRFLRWVRLGNKDAAPKYQYIASSEIPVDNVVTNWKQRFYALAIVYILTVVCGLGAVLVKSRSAVSTDRMLRTDAMFGDSTLECPRCFTDF